MKKSICNRREPRFLLAVVLVASFSGQIQAQSYELLDLEPTLSASVSNTISAGVAAGYAVNASAYHAMLWNGQSRIDLHPTTVSLGDNGYSAIEGSSGNVQVGWGSGPNTNNRPIPLVWIGTQGSVETLNLPFVHYGAQALATDGQQIVGYAIPLNKDGTSPGSSHAIVWDVTSQQPIDLGDGGNGAKAIGVGGNQQVGYVIKSTLNAALWNSSAKSLTVIHPKSAVVSVANDTDGTIQVGYSGYSVRVRAEAANGNKDKVFNYATVWKGTATSALNIHPYLFTHSYATALNGQAVVGYALDAKGINHAIAWDANYQATDLNDFLPAKYVGSKAFSVDSEGNVAGVAFDSRGYQHAVVWMVGP